MKNPSSEFREQKERAFIAYCSTALRRECIDYRKQKSKRSQREISFSQITEKEESLLRCYDTYDLDSYTFQVLDHDIIVRDNLLAEALKELTERKRQVVLLSFFEDLSDVEIARLLNVKGSTVHEHRTRSLDILKKILERNGDGNGKGSKQNGKKKKTDSVRDNLHGSKRRR